jgi:NTP pyrophosphatase (non-canonical NTP hydrolase)
MSEMRYINWTQRKISDWAQSKFGWHGPLSIAIRGNKEMAELLSALQNDKLTSLEMAEECADVAIFLLQISQRLGFDLLGMIDHKMDINSLREWEIAPDGSHQHVKKKEDTKFGDHSISTFIDPGGTGKEIPYCTICECRGKDLDTDCPGF